MKNFKNIQDKKEQQSETIKDENMKLFKRLRNNKPKVKSLGYQIDKKDKRLIKHFEDVVKLETSTDYNKLYY